MLPFSSAITIALFFPLMQRDYSVLSLVLAGRGLMEAPCQRKLKPTKPKEFSRSQISSKKMKALMSALQETFEVETLQEVNYLSMVRKSVNLLIYFSLQGMMGVRCSL